MIEVIYQLRLSFVYDFRKMFTFRSGGLIPDFGDVLPNHFKIECLGCGFLRLCIGLQQLGAEVRQGLRFDRPFFCLGAALRNPPGCGRLGLDPGSMQHWWQGGAQIMVKTGDISHFFHQSPIKSITSFFLISGLSAGGIMGLSSLKLCGLLTGNESEGISFKRRGWPCHWTQRRAKIDAA
ncbi:hypothetical protein MXMO3_00908 [Maritalea myrionectae]|uniref:Uncharacterized protein n=1 Tax=Maritalea myrionectae TaxID=454601 RepID=A0A2R4MBR7_9HYPH|nr:hypothetical protein MXMO3_00908 [Maritalea myrionectae]